MDKSAKDHIRDYLSRMVEIRGTGGATKETSYYSALENLLNAFGHDLKPQVICNGQLRNDGAGNPDFGLYTRNQIQKGEPRKGQLPERGVIEVKGLKEHTWQTADSKQATKYFDHYKLVLITNYREFRLIGEDQDGKPSELEKYTLAEKEGEFWLLAAAATATAEQHATHFSEFLRRVLMTAAPLSRAEDIAWFLASYAKDALAILESKDETSLKPLRDALETALGLKFEGKDGDHFFKSTLIQTLFYGVFSAWVVHAKKHSSPFDWKSAAYTLTVPMVKALFEQIATPSKLGALGMMPILDRTAAALNRVIRTEFFKSFDTGAAVQHFYEPFLAAYDPALRKKLGVWYTPPEIVTFMVERVDHILRTELGKPNGFADKDVYVLDPCCGTGAYVVAVLRKIEETLRSQGADSLLADDIKQAAKERILGFELLSAPFVTAHWRVGNYLSELGVPFDADHGERASIYLTNSLTGWKPPKKPKAGLPLFPELAEERDAAEHVKRDVPILVIIGNPPYDGFAGTSPDEEEGLVEPYKDGLISKWGIKKFNLDDLYVRFFRLAERRINELGRGVLAYISNYSYVSEASYVVMRENLLSTFDKFWIENMHGDRNKSEYAPDGRTSETIFAMRGFSPGIRQGVVVGLAVKTGEANVEKIVRYRDDLNAAKASDRRAELLASLNETDFDSHYEIANPEPFNKYSFRPRKVGSDFKSWPTLNDLAGTPSVNGLMEKRGGALTEADKSILENNLKPYFDKSISWEAFAKLGNPLSESAARYDPQKTRTKIIHDEGFREEQLIRYLARPFDFQYAYYSPTRPLWNEPRPQLWAWAQIKGNRYLVSRLARGGEPEGAPIYFCNCIGDDHALRTDAYFFPMKYSTDEGGLFGKKEFVNLSEKSLTYLESLGFADAADKEGIYTAPWFHALAIGFAPQYMEDHGAGIAIGWPRIPLPLEREKFDSSAKLGRHIAELLDLDSDVKGITTGTIGDHLKIFGVLTGTDLSVHAGWGRKDSKGRVNPGKGRIVAREYTSVERDAIASGTKALGLDMESVLALLGEPLDIYLNDTTYWRGVPTGVWNYFIGGYQVTKKWLSYREVDIFGRPLTKEEARQVTSITRRIASLILLGGELNTNYAMATANSYDWPEAEKDPEVIATTEDDSDEAN